MTDDTPPRRATEGKLVLAAIGGAAVFYVCMWIVSFVADKVSSPDSGTYIGVWFLGAGLSSAFGVEVAKRVAPTFNRIGLIVLMVAPIVVIALLFFFAAPAFSAQTMAAFLSALVGTGIGLGITFRDLMKPKPAPK